MDENKNKIDTQANEARKDQTVSRITPPEDASGANKPKKKMSKKTKIILLSIAGVILLAAILGIAYAMKLKNNPNSFFEEPDPQTTPMVDEYGNLISAADKNMMNGIVNVLLIGVDYAEEREDWEGKGEFHSDVMMILAINFNESTVDMISIPRDTYAKIPGVNGIYKINTSLNIGGGMNAEGGAGFLKVCETAEWMLGGQIPINYYCAVDMNAVKDLGDAIGGVEFDLETDFDLGGRYYKAGKQHMDGQGILDYMRVRKPGNISSEHQGDQNRVNRQKKMLIAVFETMKQKNLITKIPDIISAFNGNLYTNLSASQIAALALFAYDLNSANIEMHSMSGSMGMIGEWVYVFTSQSKRVSIIEEIYGIKVKKYSDYTYDAAQERYYGLAQENYITVGTKVLGEIKAILDADAKLPELSPSVSPSPPPVVSPSPVVPPAVSPSPTVPTPTVETPSVEIPDDPTPTVPDEPTPSPAPKTDSVKLAVKYRQYGPEIWALYDAAVAALEAVETESTEETCKALETAVAQIGAKVGYTKKIDWYYHYSKEYNEIVVDFR